MSTEMLQLAQLLTNHRLEVNKLESRISDLEKELNNRPQWISVEDRLPSLHERVLCLLNGEHIVLELGQESPAWEETFTAFLYWYEPYEEYMQIEWHEVTHWMPLPEPPTQEQGE